MKNIGITTMFHNSENYGGVLQAYALAEVLSQMGFQAEQILKIKKKNQRLGMGDWGVCPPVLWNLLQRKGIMHAVILSDITKAYLNRKS